MEKIQPWTGELEDIDLLLQEAEETNRIYNIEDSKTVPQVETAGITTLQKSDGGQEIPQLKSTNTNTSVIKIPQGQVIQALRAEGAMSAQTKKNLMYFGVGLGLFLLLRK